MLKDFFAGAFSYIEAISIIHKRKLWGYFLIPGLISVGVLCLILTITWFTYEDFGHWVANAWPWEFGKNIIDTAGGIFYALLLFAAFTLTLKYIIIIALGPFLSPMSEKIEYSLNQKRYSQNNLTENIKLVGRGLSVALSLLFLELLYTIPLYILMIVPGTAVILVPLIFFIQAYFAGRGNMDFVLERRYGVSTSLKVSKQYKWIAIGNGAIYMLMISSIIGVFFAPILSVAGLTVTLIKRLEAPEV